MPVAKRGREVFAVDKSNFQLTIEKIILDVSAMLLLFTGSDLHNELWTTTVQTIARSCNDHSKEPLSTNQVQLGKT